MRVNSFLAATRITATRPQGGDVADLLRADTVLQGKQQAVAPETLREGTLNNPTTTKRSAAEVQRSQDRLANWGHALQRLMGGQAQAMGQAAVLVVGQARSATGVAIAIQADQVSGVYPDWSAGPTPQQFATAAAWADTVTIRANTVDQFDTAGGRDAIAIAAGTVVGVDGGAGDDTMAERVQGTIGVSGGAGDDRVALNGGTVGLFSALGDGQDTVSLAPGTEVVVQINGAAGYSVQQT